MSELTLNLDDTTFEQLVELTRALIPGHAPAWTDHNVHDPGITLLELMAWNAEAQIYSLGRARRDERIAYAALLGVHARGPQPAAGLIWPSAPRLNATGTLPWARGTFVTMADTARSDREGAPEFALARALLLVDATLARLSVIDSDGQIGDVTMSNRQEGAGFHPFGTAGTSTLRLTLKGSMATPLAPDAKARVISLGVEVSDVPPLALPSQGERVDVHAALRATLVHGSTRHALPIVVDGTRGLLRSGVILLDVGGIDAPIAADFSIELAPIASRLVRVAAITRIEPNVLPVVERHWLSKATLTTSSTGLPDQIYRLPEPGLMFGDNLADPEVQVDDGYTAKRWQLAESFEDCGPGDARFVLDRAAGTVRFGNGVNGAPPPRGAVISIDYQASSGTRGNLPRRLRWRIRGIAGVFGENPTAMSGGKDATTLDDLQRAARPKLRRDRPIVTSIDLETAARELEDLGVARAKEMPRSARGVPGTRTLVALAARRAGEEPANPENEVWLAAIRERLKGRLPLGQRLRVVAPQYVTIGIKASLIAKPQANRAEIRNDVQRELARRFALAAARAGEAVWQFEREVTVREIMGWLRRVQAVASVVEVTLTRNGQPVDAGTARIRGTELPRLRLTADDITVLAPGARPS